MTTVLDAPKEVVFDYLSSIENLPAWATEFARELRCCASSTPSAPASAAEPVPVRVGV